MDVSNAALRPTAHPAGGMPVRSPQDPVATFDYSHYGLALPAHLEFDPSQPIQAYEHLFLNDGNLKASGHSVWEQGYISPLNESVVLETGDQADHVHISQTRHGQLNVRVNGQLYHFDGHDKEGEPVKFHLKTHGGNDKVTIDADVMQPITIETGDGHDRVQAGGGYTRVFGGNGNDVIRLGGGLGYAEGNDGDDIIMGGSGDNVMYGNNGNDRLYAGAGPSHKKSYLDGGNGDDQLYAGNGHTLLHGGLGNDRLIGHDRTTFYTGSGDDTVIANRPGDLIYGKPGDTIKRLNGSMFTAESTHNAPTQGFVIKGTADFIQRVEDDLALLRVSPQGKQMLIEMDAIARRNGAPVTIVETANDAQSHYLYGSQELKRLLQDEHAPVPGEDPKWGFMINGVPGSRADRAHLQYNRSHLDVYTQVIQVPIVGLYHEMVHAYNAGNGTAFTGTTLETFMGEPHEIHNSERQAVGLPNTAKPFDFDNDPATPPTGGNPKAFTENALNEEMGRPLRKQYAV